MRGKCGDIDTLIFMSDDAKNFFNAWRAVFTVENTRKFICAWHIHKSWRRGLQAHISSKTEQNEVYHNVRILLSEEKSYHFDSSPIRLIFGK